MDDRKWKIAGRINITPSVAQSTQMHELTSLLSVSKRRFPAIASPWSSACIICTDFIKWRCRHNRKKLIIVRGTDAD